MSVSKQRPPRDGEHYCHHAKCRRHVSKAHAKHHAKQDYSPGISRRVYKCDGCGGWHYEGSR